MKNEEKTKINTKKVNKVLDQSDKILKVVFILVIIIAIYAGTLILKEWNIINILKSLLVLLLPLLFGFIIAWLFDPVVSYMEKHKINRTVGTIIVFVVGLILLFFIVSAFIPILANQFDELVKSVPNFIKDASNFIDMIFDKINLTAGIDANKIKADLIIKIQEFGISITEQIPGSIFSFVSSIFSFIGSLFMGIIIGFYLLISFKSTTKYINTYVKNKEPGSFYALLRDINTLLKRFVKGSVVNSTIIFIISSIAFFFTGLKAPLLFGLFCGITNVIPYIGPYIGGIPAALVGFSQSTTIGIIVIIIIIITQLLDGNFLQPMIMSKSANLHPVTIIIGLVIFGSAFGIIGMIIAPPALGSLKLVLMHLNEKYKIIKIEGVE